MLSQLINSKLSELKQEIKEKTVFKKHSSQHPKFTNITIRTLTREDRRGSGIVSLVRDSLLMNRTVTRRSVNFEVLTTDIMLSADMDLTVNNVYIYQLSLLHSKSLILLLPKSTFCIIIGDFNSRQPS